MVDETFSGVSDACTWGCSVFDGSDDAVITTRGPSVIGDYSLRIRDDSAASFAVLETQNVQSMTEVELSFHFQTRNVATSELLTVSYRLDGGGWVPLAQLGPSNDVWVQETLPIVDVSTANGIEFEFRTDYASNRQRAHLDAIVLNGLGPA